MDTHVLEIFHSGDKKEIFQITSTVAGTLFGIGDGTVDVQFGVCDTNSGRACILVGIEAIAANRHANATWFSFAMAHGADEVGVCYFATHGDLARRDEKDGLIANNMSIRRTIHGETRSAASQFVSE